MKFADFKVGKRYRVSFDTTLSDKSDELLFFTVGVMDSGCYTAMTEKEIQDPSFKAELIPDPIQVGDIVRCKIGALGFTYIVLAIVGHEAWIKSNVTDDTSFIIRLDRLTKV